MNTNVEFVEARERSSSTPREGESNEPQIKCLSDLLDQMDQLADGGSRVSLGDILDAVGRRSYAPLILLCGLVILAPLLGDIPGVPTIMAAMVAIISIQMLIRSDHIWFPAWLQRRSVDHEKLKKAVKKMRPVGRFADRVFKPRLPLLMKYIGTGLTALSCLLIAMATPLMDFIPFSANVAGIALASFGIALVTEDGVMALVALLFTLGTLAIALFFVFGVF